jgi:hypothetical protein
MKTKINIYAISLLISMMCLPAFIGCSKDSNPEEEKQKFPPIEVDYSNMFGVNVYTNVASSIGSSGCDAGVIPAISSDMCGVMGIKSIRVDMYLSWFIEYDATGNLQFREANVSMYQDYLRLMRENGVENIIAVNPAYVLYPYGHPRTWYKAIPDPVTEAGLYVEFLELLEKQYKMIAERFTEITHFEYGNEMSVPNGHNINKNGFIYGASAEQNAPYVFTESELALVTADIGYYSTRGVKSGNPQAKTVLPGLYLMVPEDTRNHIKLIYEHIQSGNLPSTTIVGGSRKTPADTDPDHYFEYLNWHPYIYAEYTQEWLQMNESLYQVALDYGDVKKKVLITEFGYYDSFLASREEVIANSCVPAIKALTERIPAIEAVCIFQMFNWTSAPANVAAMERTFGIFDSPDQPNGARPKPVAISLFYHFNGVHANSDPLYKYMK